MRLVLPHEPEQTMQLHVSLSSQSWFCQMWMIDLVYANRQRQLIEEVIPVCHHAEEVDDPDLDLDPMLYVLLLELASLVHWPYVVVEVVPCRVHWQDAEVIALPVDLVRVLCGRWKFVRGET